MEERLAIEKFFHSLNASVELFNVFWEFPKKNMHNHRGFFFCLSQTMHESPHGCGVLEEDVGNPGHYSNPAPKGHEH